MPPTATSRRSSRPWSTSPAGRAATRWRSSCAANDAPWTRKQVLSADGSATRAPRVIVTYRAVPTGPTLSIADAALAEGNNGTTNAAFAVTLSAPPGASTVTVNYSTGNGTAARARGTSPPSPTGRSASPAATTTQTINIPIVGDTTVEPTETFTVTLSSPVGATLARRLGHRHHHQRRRAAADPLDRRRHRQAEGNTGTTTAGFTVTLSARPGASTVTVNYATGNGTAAAPGRLHRRHQRDADLRRRHDHPDHHRVTVIGDTTVEANETFTVTLSASGRRHASPTARPSAPSPTTTRRRRRCRSPTSTVSRGQQRHDQPRLHRHACRPSAGASTVTVNYATGNGTATAAPGDYTAAPRHAHLRRRDDHPDHHRPGPRRHHRRGQRDLHRHPQRSRRAPPSPTARPPAPSPTTTRADAHTADRHRPEATGAAARRTPASSSPSRPSPAPAPSPSTTPPPTAAPSHRGDYTAGTGTLTFTGTPRPQTINVPVIGDTAVEANETFTVTLIAPVGATIADGAATGTITNDDAAAADAVDRRRDPAEGNSGTANARLHRHALGPARRQHRHRQLLHRQRQRRRPR